MTNMFPVRFKAYLRLLESLKSKALGCFRIVCEFYLALLEMGMDN